jgi:hypothetical protein
VGNLKGKPGNRATGNGAHATPRAVEIVRRSATEAARTETPYFLPDAPEATSVEVRRPKEQAEQSQAEAGTAAQKPIFIPKEGPRKEAPAPDKVRAHRPPSSNPPSGELARLYPRFRALVAVPFVSAVLLAIALALSGHDRAGLYRVELAIVEGLGFWGCLAAALIFERGDYLRRAWFLEMSCFGLIFVGDLTLTTGVFSNKPWTALANGLLTLAANAAAMGGTYKLARAARVAGIEMPGSDATRRGVQALALAFALLSAGPAAVISARQVIAGDHNGLMYFASCLGDIFCFAMIAPLLLTTIAMRGGLLAWPWGLRTASGLAWLVFDAIQTLAPIVFHIAPEDARPVQEIARCVACTCAFSAGLAQRWIIIDASA